MKLLKFLFGFLFLIFFTSCVTRVSLDHQNFINDKKVGIIINIDSIAVAKAGGQGVLDIVLTPGNRFMEPLKEIEPRINLTEKIESEISDILKFYKKPFVFLQEDFDVNQLDDFNEKKSGKTYRAKDFRNFKSSHDVDEIMYINVVYGILVSYYGMIEIGKDGFANMQIETIDLDDNSLMQREGYRTTSKIKGNWKKGEDYENLTSAIQEAVDKAVKSLDTKI